MKTNEFVVRADKDGQPTFFMGVDDTFVTDVAEAVRFGRILEAISWADVWNVPPGFNVRIGRVLNGEIVTAVELV